jgi:hypothetical protein
MIEHFILSDTDALNAQAEFNRILNEEPFTLLLVLGSHPVSMTALTTANSLVNSGSINYKSVRVAHAIKPEFILNILENLKVNPEIKDLKWSSLPDFAILSISNYYNNIGQILKKSDPNGISVGDINFLVLKAQAYDKVL